MQVINSYFPGYVQYCVLPNNFSIMPQKMTMHNPISMVHGLLPTICRAYLRRKVSAKRTWRIVHAPLR